MSDLIKDAEMCAAQYEKDGYTDAPNVIRELIEKYKEALNACESALKYDDAIRCRVDEGGNVNFNKEGEAFMEGSGTNLDALYEEWMSKADKVVSFSQKKESERKPLY